jgi:hypothetical protein
VTITSPTFLEVPEETEQRMNIFQKRHAILGAHLGERFTPALLRAEFVRSFPNR